MSSIVLLERGLNVSGVHWALLSNPHLWNQNTVRTEHPDSPHHGLDDIWVRFGTEDDARTGAPHESSWYPSAEVLGVKPLIMSIFAATQGTTLGGVLITRIPPGERCKPHTDPGWHARQYEKFAVQIASAPGQKFCFEDSELETKPGDVFWFDNSKLHWVENPTNYERMTMIICIRKEN